MNSIPCHLLSMNNIITVKTESLYIFLSIVNVVLKDAGRSFGL